MKKEQIEMALSDARRTLEKTQSFGIKVGLGYADGTFRWLPVPEAAAEFLNHGELKKMFFSGIREIARQSKATEVVFVNDSWVGMPTQKQRDMPVEERRSLMLGKNLNQAEADGLVTRREALVITIQTKQEQTIITQVYDRTENGSIQWGERDTVTSPQESFSGRMKMFGG